MALHLRPLRDDELPAYVEHGRAQYAHDLVSQAGLSEAAAATKMENDWSRLFPEGEIAPDNEIHVLEDESGERVGSLWFALRPNDSGEPAAFVYMIEIEPEFRGHGFGREGMQLFETEVRARGLSEANLTVLGGNDVARSLYRSLGYTERAVFMSRELY